MSKPYFLDEVSNSEVSESFKGKSLTFPESPSQKAHFPNKIQLLH